MARARRARGAEGAGELLAAAEGAREHCGFLERWIWFLDGYGGMGLEIELFFRGMEY